MSQTVIGIFDSSTEAQNAVEKLSNNGFTIDQVDVTYDNNRSALEGTSDMSSADTSTRRVDDDNDGFGEKVSRFFKSMFDDDDESTRYSNVARNSAIVTVITDTREQAERAADILDASGAVDVDERSRQSTAGDSGIYNQNMYQSSGSLTADDENIDQSRYASTANLNTGDADLDINRGNDLTDDTNRSIPIIEEELHVGKREVERGRVRLRSRIIERPVEEHIRLREERVTVERTPVNRPVREGDMANFREGEIEVTQRAEVPVVNKEARVVEEVTLNKEVRDREEVVRDTVRKTEVDVDDTTNLNNESTTSRRSTDNI